MTAYEVIEGLRRRGWDDGTLLRLLAGYADVHDAFWSAPRSAGALPPSFTDFPREAEVAPAAVGGGTPLAARIVPAPTYTALVDALKEEAAASREELGTRFYRLREAFEDGSVAELHFCRGEGGAYIEAALVVAGTTVARLPPITDDPAGPYVFEYEGRTYALRVVVEGGGGAGVGRGENGGGTNR